MTKRVGVVFIVILAIYGAWVARYKWVQVKVIDKDSRVTTLESNKLLLSAYASFVLNLRSGGVYVSANMERVEKMHPRIVSIVLSDKKRIEYPRTEDAKTIMGVGLSREKDISALFFVWANDEIMASEKRSFRISEYVIDVLNHYKDPDLSGQPWGVSELLALDPIKINE